MTLPSVVSDLLMFAPSLRRCPVAPVELALSEPAKSTRLARRQLESRPYSKGEGVPDSGYFLGIQICIDVVFLHGQQQGEYGMGPRRTE